MTLKNGAVGESCILYDIVEKRLSIYNIGRRFMEIVQAIDYYAFPARVFGDDQGNLGTFMAGNTRQNDGSDYDWKWLSGALDFGVKDRKCLSGLASFRTSMEETFEMTLKAYATPRGADADSLPEPSEATITEDDIDFGVSMEPLEYSDKFMIELGGIASEAPRYVEELDLDVSQMEGKGGVSALQSRQET